MRRAAILLLALILVPVLCGVHSCDGEDCLFCAQIAEMRRDSACPLPLAALIFSVLTLCAARPQRRALRFIFPRTPIDLKVRLTD